MRTLIQAVLLSDRRIHVPEYDLGPDFFPNCRRLSNRPEIISFFYDSPLVVVSDLSILDDAAPFTLIAPITLLRHFQRAMNHMND